MNTKQNDFIKLIARMTTNAECRMSSDDAINTLSLIIEHARMLADKPIEPSVRFGESMSARIS